MTSQSSLPMVHILPEKTVTLSLSRSMGLSLVQLRVESKAGKHLRTEGFLLDCVERAALIQALCADEAQDTESNSHYQRSTAPVPAPTPVDGWHCGNRNLQSQFAAALIVCGKASAREAGDIEYLAEQAGPAFTRAAIARLMPGFMAENLTDDDIPF